MVVSDRKVNLVNFMEMEVQLNLVLRMKNQNNCLKEVICNIGNNISQHLCTKLGCEMKKTRSLMFTISNTIWNNSTNTFTMQFNSTFTERICMTAMFYFFH